MMLLLDKPETRVFVSRHRIFERRDADAYQVEETLTVMPLLAGEVQAELEPAQEEALPAEEGELAVWESLKQDSNQQRASIPEVGPEAEAAPTARQVQFRQVLLEVDDPDEFWAGVVGGQVTAVEESWPLTSRQVFELFEDAIHDLEFSENWLTGYLLGLGDALLRRRKIYPPAYAARLKPLASRPKRRKRH